nr:PREDICTED: angiopoietin-2-like [Apteryx mantelli mantelli]
MAAGCAHPQTAGAGNPGASSAAGRRTPSAGLFENCTGCVLCSEDNGCIACHHRLFLLIWRDGIRQHGVCVHTCPPGYFGVRGFEVNRCTSSLVVLLSFCLASCSSEAGPGRRDGLSGGCQGLLRAPAASQGRRGFKGRRVRSRQGKTRRCSPCSSPGRAPRGGRRHRAGGEPAQSPRDPACPPILSHPIPSCPQLESYIQASVKPEMAQLQQTAVQNHTATMLEIGSSLLNQTAEQTRKLTDVEAQVLNQTSRIELQLLENSLSTTKLEKQLLVQTNEIHKLQNRNKLALQGYSGTAGQQSGMVLQGANFSTRDADNDNCLCKCAQMLSGGWWFDACGLSNLNGVYYPARHNIRKLNGIRWHYFQGPSYSLKGTRMLIRPAEHSRG